MIGYPFATRKLANLGVRPGEANSMSRERAVDPPEGDACL